MGRYDNTFFKYDIENCIEAIKKVEEKSKKMNADLKYSNKLIFELKKLLNTVKKLSEEENK
jgi:hypothetical protein